MSFNPDLEEIQKVGTKRFATLRTCASCEWIFKADNNDPTCPKCQFGSYGARYVYGDKVYRYAKTQEPWKEKKVLDYKGALNKEIQEIQSDDNVVKTLNNKLGGDS